MKKLTGDKQNECIPKFRQENISIRQISRLTGSTVGTIRNFRKHKEPSPVLNCVKKQEKTGTVKTVPELFPDCKVNLLYLFAIAACAAARRAIGTRKGEQDT